MGYLEKKFSTIFKGPWALYWKERGEGKHLVRFVHNLKQSSQKIKLDIVDHHYIGKAIRKQKKLVRYGRKAEKTSYNLGFNVQLGMEKSLEIIRRIEGLWEELKNAVYKQVEKYKKAKEEMARNGPKTELERKKRENELKRLSNYVLLNNNLKILEKEFERELLKGVYVGVQEDKTLYWKDLEPIIKVAESGRSEDSLMQKVALFLKTKGDVSKLASIAFRWEARGLRRDTAALKRDEKKMKGIIVGIANTKINREQIVRELSEWIKSVMVHVKREFKNTYLLWKRDFLLILVLLHLLNSEEENDRMYAMKHLMPLEAEKENIKEIEGIKKDIADNAHVLAQGFRRILSEEDVIISTSKRIKM